MARRSGRDWECIVGRALRGAGDLLALEESPLAEETSVQARARTRYPWRTLGAGLAVRDYLIDAATTIAEDCGELRFGRFCVLYARGVPIADIAKTLQMSRPHLSTCWRPKAVRLITAQLRSELHERTVA